MFMLNKILMMTIHFMTMIAIVHSAQQQNITVDTMDQPWTVLSIAAICPRDRGERMR